jgi:hypothetical protein
MVRLKSNNYTFAILLMGFSFYIHTIFKKAELSLQLEHEKSNKLLENILPLSIIQKLRENTLNSNIVKTKTLSVLPDKNATTHTVNRVRRAGSSAPKKASLVL